MSDLVDDVMDMVKDLGATPVVVKEEYEMAGYHCCTQKNPCVICNGHKRCSFVKLDVNLLGYACRSKEHTGTRPLSDGTGYFYLEGDTAKMKEAMDQASIPKPPLENATEICKKMYLNWYPPARKAYAKHLGTTSSTLIALRVGVCHDLSELFPNSKDNWAKDVEGYTFPMRDGANNIIGIQVRFRSNKKVMVSGSVSGLFIPQSYDKAKAIVLHEGCSDTIKSLDMGMNAVGLPSCSAGFGFIQQMFLDPDQNKWCMYFHDHDERKERKNKKGEVTSYYWPGQDGAAKLGDLLLDVGVNYRTMHPKKVGTDFSEMLKSFPSVDKDALMKVITSTPDHVKDMKYV